MNGPSAVAPDDEEKPFVVRWNLLVRILLAETSVKAVAWAAMTYAGSYDGSNVFPSNARMCRNTGLSENTVRKAWKTLCGLHMAEVTEPSHWNGKFRTTDVYQLRIPGNWRDFAVLGPKEGQFRCGYCHCHKAFDPPPVAVLEKAGEVRWTLTAAVFCGSKCRESWNREETNAGRALPWGKSDDAWKLFRQSRGDDWP